MKKIIGNTNIITDIYGTQTYNSIMCGYLCIYVLVTVLKGKKLIDYTNRFSPNDYEKK